MSFVEAVSTCLFRKYFEFRGRASRAEYWWFVVFGVSVNVAAAVAGIRPLSYLVTALLVVPQMAVTVRRLHDTNRSGWWILLYVAGWIPGVGFWVGLMPGLVMLWFMIQKGDASAYVSVPARADTTRLSPCVIAAVISKLQHYV